MKIKVDLEQPAQPAKTWRELTPFENCGHPGKRGRFKTHTGQEDCATCKSGGFCSKRNSSWCEDCVTEFQTCITDWTAKQALARGELPF